ncbi:hypothetical protein [Methylorubrum sp. GM97]|uniref:hypothetical protein n=1 Tax=Methylorubrum sp. GM97 TaxID=2938232 RepID=UPI0021871341|nr:hypothetical protein [Methylorubrum sp. GM97]BDL41773.1 hypothetical protein MSPGM_43630 [Methylorubrum sp. GM97]
MRPVTLGFYLQASHVPGMAYRIEFRKDGVVSGEIHDLEDRETAKLVAVEQMARFDAEIAIVIDVDGRGVEVASITREAMAWDDEQTPGPL